MLCALPDPVERCRHCFDELEEEETLCRQCRKEKKLPVVRAYVFDSESPAHLLEMEVEAFGSFAFLQWIQLDWPTPDVIIPMPNSVEVGAFFAHLLDRPFVQALSKGLEYKEGRVEEDQILLLFDLSNDVETLKKGVLALAESFPQKIYLLSLLN